MKDWTEPNGRFIINIPIEWQYRNSAIENVEEKSPYSFESYEDSLGCFQLSCYPLKEKDINTNIPIQKNNSKIKWLKSRMDDKEFDVFLFHALVDDLFCMAKYIYSSENRGDLRIIEQVNKVKLVLDSFRVIPQSERKWAINLSKHDNFLASLAASYDLVKNAYDSNSYIELIVILANQIDAFLRSALILKRQLEKKTNEIEIKYIFQGEEEKGIMERDIFKEAYSQEIIDQETYKELNDLYNLRNRVIHRYIISFLKTRDILKTAYKYAKLSEKIRLILIPYEEMQFGKGFGVYGRGYRKDDVFDVNDYRRAYAMVNDKHLIENLRRKI